MEILINRKTEFNHRYGGLLRWLTTDAHRKQVSERNRRLWKDPKYRAKMEKVLEVNNIRNGINPQYSLKHSFIKQKWWKDPNNRIKGSEAMKEVWKRPGFREMLVPKIIKSNIFRENGLEKRFEAILNYLFPNRFKYVGDGYTFIGCKVPDFIDFKNRLIIELYGEYWHKDDWDFMRINHFAKYGFRCLVVWDYELKDLVKLKNKLRRFVR